MAKEGKFSIRDWAAKKLSTIVEKLQDDILQKSFCHAQRAIRTVLCIVVEKMMFLVLHGELVRGMLGACMKKSIDAKYSSDSLL